MLTEEQQRQLDREQERRIKSEDFHRAHPEFALLGNLHPVMRAALAPLASQPNGDSDE